jgi:hypothetical protein
MKGMNLAIEPHRLGGLKQMLDLSRIGVGIGSVDESVEHLEGYQMML